MHIYKPKLSIPLLGVVILQWVYPTAIGYPLSLLAMIVIGVLAWQKPWPEKRR